MSGPVKVAPVVLLPLGVPLAAAAAVAAIAAAVIVREEVRRKSLVWHRERYLNRLMAEDRPKAEEHARPRWMEEAERAEGQESLGAAESVVEYLAEVEGLRSDQVAMRWCASEIEAAGRIAEELQTALEQDDPATVARRAKAERIALDQVVRTAHEAEHAESRRRYVVKGIVEVLTAMGFAVSTPRLTSDDPASPVVFEGARTSGATIAITIPREGEVRYEVDGYAMRVETQPSGARANTCDEAQADIEAMHAALESQLAIGTGELSWPGKPATRRAREADRLPEATDRTMGGQR